MKTPTDDLAWTLAAAAHGAVALERIAADVLEVVSSRMPVLGVTMNLHNPISGDNLTLCSEGFDAELLQYLRSRTFLEEDLATGSWSTSQASARSAGATSKTMSRPTPRSKCSGRPAWVAVRASASQPPMVAIPVTCTSAPLMSNCRARR